MPESAGPLGIAHEGRGLLLVKHVARGRGLGAVPLAVAEWSRGIVCMTHPRRRVLARPMRDHHGAREAHRRQRRTVTSRARSRGERSRSGRVACMKRAPQIARVSRQQCRERQPDTTLVMHRKRKTCGRPRARMCARERERRAHDTVFRCMSTWGARRAMSARRCFGMCVAQEERGMTTTSSDGAQRARLIVMIACALWMMHCHGRSNAMSVSPPLPPAEEPPDEPSAYVADAGAPNP